MQDKLKSEGKCLFCGKTFAKAGINRHLIAELEKLTLVKPNGLSFLLKIESNPRYGTSPYFLSIWVDGNASMGKIDHFLRAIWLECCGHMSAFRNPAAGRSGGGLLDFFEAEELLEAGKIKQYEKLMEETAGEVPMSRKAKNVFYKDLKLEYEYDFGSSTDLLITTLAEFPFKANELVVLLSRNEPPEILCDLCEKQPATQICTIHNWDENSLFCEGCAKKHARECADFKDYAAMPVVNSPRMGVCGYTGGTIDMERGGFYRK